jgi:hypothetical protein
MLEERGLRFFPSRVVGFPGVTEVAVFADRLELFSVGPLVVVIEKLRLELRDHAVPNSRVRGVETSNTRPVVLGLHRSRKVLRC